MEPPEVTEIKDALRRCKDREEVERIADKYRDRVKDLMGDQKTRMFAIQIINLKKYMLGE